MKLKLATLPILLATASLAVAAPAERRTRPHTAHPPKAEGASKPKPDTKPNRSLADFVARIRFERHDVHHLTWNPGVVSCSAWRTVPPATFSPGPKLPTPATSWRPPG